MLPVTHVWMNRGVRTEVSSDGAMGILHMGYPVTIVPWAEVEYDPDNPQDVVTFTMEVTIMPSRDSRPVMLIETHPICHDASPGEADVYAQLIGEAIALASRAERYIRSTIAAAAAESEAKEATAA